MNDLPQQWMSRLGWRDRLLCHGRPVVVWSALGGVVRLLWHGRETISIDSSHVDAAAERRPRVAWGEALRTPGKSCDDFRSPGGAKDSVVPPGLCF